MQRIIFLNRFFFPDHSATSQIVTDLAFHLASVGRSVHVVTGRQRYDAPQVRYPEDEAASGVHIHRVATTRFGRSALIGRGIDYLSFYKSAWSLVQGLAREGDIIVAKTDPPLISVLAMRAAERRRAHLVNWLQDLYPEVAIALGVPFLNGALGRGLVHLRDGSLKAAAANVVIGERMADRLLSLGANPERIHVIPNWIDDAAIRPVSREDNPLREEWGIGDKFVVGYSGNLGRAHEFETVLGAAEQLRNNANIVFLFVGDGYRAAELKRRVNERGLSESFRFVPYQDRSALIYSLSAPDVHWISLKPELEGLIVPSKFFGAAAAGRPIIAITANDGEIARLVQRHECGMIIEPGDAEALAEALVTLAANPEQAASMGHHSRRMLDTHFTRQQAFERWRYALDSIH